MGLSELFGATPDQHYLRAKFEEQTRGRLADTTGRTGDDCNLVIESLPIGCLRHIVSPSPLPLSNKG